MLSKPNQDPALRLSALRKLLEAGEISTQEDLVRELKAQRFAVTQSTISRDLSRLNAIKTRDGGGRIVYRLPDDVMIPTPSGNEMRGLLVDIHWNESLIVVKTTPGSASLLARLLDQSKPEGILGTIAGDDTIFIAPSSIKKIAKTVERIRQEFS